MSFGGLPTTNQAAVELPNFRLGIFESNIDMSTETTFQFTGVKLVAASGTGVVGPAALGTPSAGDPILGVLQNNPAVADAGEVIESGLSKGLLSNTVSVGTILAVDGSGNFLTATTGQYGVAQACQAGVAGNVITILVKNFGKQ